MNTQLMQIVLDTIDFFANCEDDVLDPGVAVSKLEEIAFMLQQLPEGEKRQFAEFVQHAAETNQAKSEFYRSVPANIGLA